MLNDHRITDEIVTGCNGRILLIRKYIHKDNPGTGIPDPPMWNNIASVIEVWAKRDPVTVEVIHLGSFYSVNIIEKEDAEALGWGFTNAKGWFKTT